MSKELTEQNAKDILEFVFPEEIKSGDIVYVEILKSNGIDRGFKNITSDNIPVVGIEYRDFFGRNVLEINNTKVILWLYKNGYDIFELLAVNKYLSEMEDNFYDICLDIRYLTGEPLFFITKRDNVENKMDLIAESKGHPKTKEEIQKKLEKICNKKNYCQLAREEFYRYED